jgi:hypothetical protein
MGSLRPPLHGYDDESMDSRPCSIPTWARAREWELLNMIRIAWSTSLRFPKNNSEEMDA